MEIQGNQLEESEKNEILIEELQNALNRLKDRQISLSVEKSNKEANPYFKKGTRHLAEFFYAKGFLIVDYEKDVSSHYQLGKQIYACLEVSWDFNTQLLASKNKEFKYDASKLTDKNYVKLRNLCKQMQEKGMLTFRQEERAFFITSRLNGKDRYYLSGECYEEANRYLIDKTIREHSQNLGFSVYRNVRLKKADSTDDKTNDIQLDFVVDFNDRVYIFETKAGMRMKICDWVDRTRLFAGEKDKFITCCLQDFDPKTFEPLILLRMKFLETDFKNLLDKEFSS